MFLPRIDKRSITLNVKLITDVSTKLKYYVISNPRELNYYLKKDRVYLSNSYNLIIPIDDTTNQCYITEHNVGDSPSLDSDLEIELFDFNGDVVVSTLKPHVDSISSGVRRFRANREVRCKILLTPWEPEDKIDMNQKRFDKDVFEASGGVKILKDLDVIPNTIFELCSNIGRGDRSIIPLTLTPYDFRLISLTINIVNYSKRKQISLDSEEYFADGLFTILSSPACQRVLDYCSENDIALFQEFKLERAIGV